MFAEDAGLLAGNIFKRMLDQANRRPEDFVSLSKNLFRAMAMRDGGLVGIDRVDWFNGGAGQPVVPSLRLVRDVTAPQA